MAPQSDFLHGTYLSREGRSVYNVYRRCQEELAQDTKTASNFTGKPGRRWGLCSHTLGSSDAPKVAHNQAVHDAFLWEDVQEILLAPELAGGE